MTKNVFSKMDAKFGKWIVKTFAKRLIRHRVKYGGKIDVIDGFTSCVIDGKRVFLDYSLKTNERYEDVNV